MLANKEMSVAVRMRSILPVVVAVLLFADQPARAQSRTPGCIGHHYDLARNGTTSVEGHTRAGQPCQMGFGIMGGDVEALQVAVQAAHGAVSASDKQENRRFLAYFPHAGFVGRDGFELLVRITPRGTLPGRATYTTRVKVDMNVTP
jgi:hypothetical protein